MSERTDAEIEAAAKAIYPILQDILNGRVLRISSADVPEFALARAALAAADAVAPATARIEELERMDREAATYVESVICMRTAFTGEPPYVGWKGLGLALTEALDKRDAMKARIEALEAALKLATVIDANHVAAGNRLAEAVSRILPPYVAAGANEPRAWRELRAALAAWRAAEGGHHAPEK